MFELRDLNQFIRIAECGTISRAAEELYLSQPALSRAMQRLEGELGVELFTRTKNRVELNDCGKYFASLAGGIIESCNRAVGLTREFYSRSATLSIGACAPAPLWKLAMELTPRLSGEKISTKVCGEEELLSGFARGEFKIIITRAPVEGCICREYCREKLMLLLPCEHRLAQKSELTFPDIDGITMLLYEDIGVWTDVKERLPHTRFIVQSKFEDFTDLVKQSAFPSFTTNLSYRPGEDGGRVAVPLVGEGTEHIFYICVKEENKGLLW